MNIETEILDQVRVAVSNTVKNGLEKYLESNLFGYNSPFNPLIKDALAKIESLPAILTECVDEVTKEPEFKAELKIALRKRLVNELVKAFNLQDTLKELRSNPDTKKRLLDCLETLI